MVLHANHQFAGALGHGSAYSTMTSTTAASSLRATSIRQERSVKKLAKPKHKPEPPGTQCHFRFGTAAKQIYEKGGEAITQIEWETLNLSLRKTLRGLEHQDAERQALVVARLTTAPPDFAPKTPCPEYAPDFQALLAVSRASDPKAWRKGISGWLDLEKQAKKAYVDEGTVNNCRGVTCSIRKLEDGVNNVVTELYLPGLELGDAGPPPFIAMSSLKHLETLILSDNGFAGNPEYPTNLLEDHVEGFALPTLKVLDLTGNGFTGPFPAHLGALTGLTTLKLGRNKLAGPLPAAWRALKRLDTLDVHSNKLTGDALPAWLIEGCRRLRDYRAGDNGLTRLHVPGPCGVQRLELFGNALEGPLSETIHLCAELRHLDLSKNGLAGPLPVGALGSLPLTGLYLVGNRLGDPQADGADVQALVPRCLVSVDRAPPRIAEEDDAYSVYEEPQRLAPAPARASSLYRDDEATAPPPPDDYEELREELVDMERSLVLAVRRAEDLACAVKARRHEVLAGMPTDGDVNAFGRIARPPAAAMPVFLCLCRLVFPADKIRDRDDDGKNWKKLQPYLLRDHNNILDAMRTFDARDHRERLAELQHQYFSEIRPDAFTSRRTWATVLAETRPPLSDDALARLQAVGVFCGRWLLDLPGRVEMQDRIRGLDEEVEDLQASRKETFRRTQNARKWVEKKMETTFRHPVELTYTCY